MCMYAYAHISCVYLICVGLFWLCINYCCCSWKIVSVVHKPFLLHLMECVPLNSESLQADLNGGSGGGAARQNKQIERIADLSWASGRSTALHSFLMGLQHACRTKRSVIVACDGQAFSEGEHLPRWWCSQNSRIRQDMGTGLGSHNLMTRILRDEKKNPDSMLCYQYSNDTRDSQKFPNTSSPKKIDWMSGHLTWLMVWNSNSVLGA